VSEIDKLRARIEATWGELDAIAGSLDDAELARSEGGQWAVKDHLAHVAAWEQSLIGLLEGKSRLETMGLPKEADRSTDAINAALYDLHKAKTSEEAKAFFRDTHRTLMEVFATLDDAGLELPYSHYQPHGRTEEESELPVIGWVAGNTYDHYTEHTGWIRSSSGEAG